MSNSITDTDNQKAILLTQQAHTAELAGQYKEAYELQTQVSSLLVKVIANGKKKSEERRRAKLQLRAAQERTLALQVCAQGTGTPPDPLPSALTVQREVTNPTPGTILLTMVEMGRRTILADGLQQPAPEPQQASNPPLLTPLLSPSLPDVTYHIYAEKFTRFFAKTWIYYHIKNAAKTQTLYTLAALKRRRYQIPSCTVSRAAEHHNPCVAIVITPVRPRQYASETRAVGRPFKILTGTQKTVLEAPDRLERDWNPRRFSYGGRRFVWKEPKALMNSVATLHEVGKEWPDPKSKTGKKLDEIHPRPLAWGDSKSWAVNKVCTIHMVGGLDQMFRELVLASVVTNQLIRRQG